jgi:hypothetical protein
MAPSSGRDGLDGRAQRRTEPGRLYQVLPRNAHHLQHAAGAAATLTRVFRAVRACAALLMIVLALVGCSGDAAASFDPAGPCTTDGSAAGAYPQLEARVPTTFLGAPPEKLDSGRHCSAAALGSLATAGFSEVRFAGGTWSFGAERAAALAVFTAKGLTADDMAEFYLAGASAAPRTNLLAGTAVTLAGRPGHRLDTQTGERLQTVEVWPAAAPDTVNVVITNDLPDARIADAVDAFGGR